MKKFVIAITLVAALAAPALAESYYWGEIQYGGNVWIDGWGDWGEVGYDRDDYYVYVDGFGDWLWIDASGDIWVDGYLWGYMNPFGDVYSDAAGFLFTIEYDSGKDEFYYDGVSAFDPQTVFFVLAFEEKFFGWEVGLGDVLDFNQPPDALIDYDRSGGYKQFQFYSDVLDLDGEVTDVLWDFGDGTSSTAFDPLHIYGRDGKFWISLTAWDDGGASDQTWLQVKVKSQRPKVNFKRRLVYAVHGKVQFFEKAKGRNGPIVSWLWEFGDGTTSTEANPVHVFPTPGDWIVTLTVTDSVGEVAVKSKRVKVKFRSGS